MDIVIFDAGETGRFLAETLSAEKHNVTLIDPNPQKLIEISQNADIATICNHGINWKILKEANKSGNSIFLGVSNDDGMNLTACAIAKSLNYHRTIARVAEISLLDETEVNFKNLFHVDFLLAPEIIVSHDLFKHIINPKAALIENFAHGKVQIQTHTIIKDWKYSDRPLSEVDFKDRYLVALVKRKPKDNEQNGSEVIYPRGDTRIFEGDEVTFIGKIEDMMELPSLLGIGEKSVKSVILCGASSYQRHLAHILKDKGISVKIIESDRAFCEDLSRELPFATIIHHNETDKEFLIEEHIASVDVFVSCSRSTEKNLLVATLAQDLGCKDVITLVADDSFSHLLNKLGISYTLSEKISIANVVFSTIHGEVISSISSLYQNQSKVIELSITENSPLAGMKICDAAKKLPKNCVLGFILHKDQVLLAKGPETLNPGDFLMTFIAPDQIEAFQKLL